MFGAGMKPSDRDDIASKAYSTGYIDLVPKLTRFVSILANGGRPPKDERDDEAEAEGADPKNDG
jgi:hypothetical protein